ncbi:MAG: DNA-binding protein [Candidatus Thiodiazotropha sp. (ex Lucinoma borealis)]|nr:DNA-binding protein [Candidatus Thiodiazotropha sp. (ex Lucinoma borealis)]
MTRLVFHHDHNNLPAASPTVMPVQLYGLSGQGRGDISVIGNPIVDKIRRLGVALNPEVMDFLSIALAVTAADTFVRRDDAADGWSRQITIQLPLHEPDRWNALVETLQKAFHFLSGDQWEFQFSSGGFAPPVPYKHRDRFQLIKMRGLDSVSLFSGGLDSAIGVIDLFHEGRKPLLVSHAYKGDSTHQDKIVEQLIGRYSRFAVNAHPVSASGETDITMRTRSSNFIAFAAVAACAVKAVNQIERVDLFVPENGFISLNAPLTTRRIGSLSTRTTHPYFIGLVQEIFDAVGIPCLIRNPYQFMTKGEMVLGCKDQQLLNQIVCSTVSCSHWKRANQQCGYCVPCNVRRAALHEGGKSEDGYVFDDLSRVLLEPDKRDDVMALCVAIAQKDTRKIGPWISDSGPLPTQNYSDYQKVFVRGLDEVNKFFKAMGIL